MTNPVPLATSTAAGALSSVLKAPAHWREIDFISDLHLQSSEPATFAVWRSFMQTTPADAVFILGDLFEVWVGDDALDNPHISNIGSGAFQPGKTFEQACVEVLHNASQRLDIFFIHGNRDFLLSHAFAKASGAVLLNDPTCLAFAGADWLLSHGDALCLDDTEYQAFRALVRGDSWKQNFLAKPLQERLVLAQQLREKSESRKKSGAPYVDVDEAQAIQWLRAHQAVTLIHGHTHRPADHLLSAPSPGSVLEPPFKRLVLSDWDATAQPPRTEILRLGVDHPPLRIKT